MSKLSFTSVVNKAYSGTISEARTFFQRLASWVERDPTAATDLNNQLQALTAATGFVQNQPGTKLLVTSGVKITAPAITGSYVNGYTLTIAGGVVTAIVAS
jgi:hypothetical protein